MLRRGHPWAPLLTGGVRNTLYTWESIMDLHAAISALARARKRAAHAVRQEAEATSPRARQRQSRRLKNARQAEADARWTAEHLAFEGV